MNSRERVINAIERKPIDRIPKYDSFWDTTISEFQKQGMPVLPPMPMIDADGILKPCGNPVGDYFGFDIDVMYLDTSMRLPAKIIEEDEERYIVQDRYGWIGKKYKDRSSSIHFLDYITKTRQDWDRLKNDMIMDPADTARIDSLSNFLHFAPYPSWKGAAAIYNAFRNRNKYIMFACYGPYECTWRHHGFESTLIDLIEESEWMEEMFDHVTNLIISIIKHSISIGVKPDGLYMIEDLGEMRTTLFSPGVFKSLLLPQYKKIAKFLHENSIHLIQHSCGKVDSFIPSLIEAGLDVLQAIQVNTGQDIVKLKKLYGKQLTFFGNIGVNAFEAGKIAIKDELCRKIPVAKEGYGYIYHSDHSIPPDVKFETYQYCMDLLNKLGAYP